ncbi:peptidoglycan-binding domain-containing protein [Halomonas sp. SpR8]|uniref:peptidoglycan-binding domain-containing protein n=1 Tax=Halomonas sp. SpR8 TaxID=3050463 RepID=UPI0027E570D5|nr:peptidoglycan-binding domain-containing protein [Halomonas sp. SpR8]MDQ7728171.1 peptidoglycan-binding domain-containing protein [Halomonas sp. SpR8]
MTATPAASLEPRHFPFKRLTLRCAAQRLLRRPLPWLVAGIGVASLTTPAFASSLDDALSQIQPGQCWAVGAVNPRPQMETVEIQVKDQQATINVTPAEIEQGFKRVETREGTLEYRIEPPTYRTVEERVMTRPPVERFEVVPAEFEEQQRTVVVEEERRSLESCQAGGNSSSMSFCMQEHPAREERVSVQVMVKPETTRVVVDPAEYTTVTRQVIDKPARVIEVWNEASEEVVPTQEVASPARTSQSIVPRKTRLMERIDYQGEPQLEMRQVLCDNEITPTLVEEIQNALRQYGFNVGPIDGRLGPRTFDALREFQNQRGLVQSGLTFESLESLAIPAP